MEDMVNLLQFVLGPRTSRHQQSQGPLTLRHLDEEDPEPQLPGQFPRSASFTFGATSGQATATNNILEDEDIEMTDADQDEQDEEDEEHAIPERLTSPPLIASLFERFGLTFTSDDDTDGLFSTYGNLGDYALDERTLDNIITRMMEAGDRSGGPVAASDEVIASIPHHKLTREELDAKTECSVCKDEFVKEDNCLQLKCNHIFHEDCIKPWLKTSATCPTCRYAVVPQERNDNEEESEEDVRPEGNERRRLTHHRSLSLRRRREGSSTSTSSAPGPRLPGSFPFSSARR
ncbi:hypothetical protein BGX34_002497 [Mortierella sp. NVP85]|nr:hypothetical protein BGX34_002497 [Mortierella sp. NVP85]